MSSSCSRPARASCGPARPSATYGSLELTGRAERERESEEAADEEADRPARRTFAGTRVRRVATGGDRRQLSRGRKPSKCDDHGRQWYVAHGDELEQVPRRVEAEVQPEGQRAEQDRRPQEPCGERSRPERDRPVP